MISHYVIAYVDGEMVLVIPYGSPFIWRLRHNSRRCIVLVLVVKRILLTLICFSTKGLLTSAVDGR